MPFTCATIVVFDAGYFTFLISMRSLLCSASFCWSSFDMPAPALLALASSLPLLAAFGDLVPAASALEKLGTASPNANAIIQPSFHLRIEILLVFRFRDDLMQARS